VGTPEIGGEVLVGPCPRELHHGRAQRERHGEAVLARVEQQEIEPERAVGLRTDRVGALADLLRGLIVAAERAETAGARDRRDQLGVRRRAHAAQGDRVIDVEEVADRRSNHVAFPSSF
jgi:hypothetical protein